MALRIENPDGNFAPAGSFTGDQRAGALVVSELFSFDAQVQSQLKQKSDSPSSFTPANQRELGSLRRMAMQKFFDTFWMRRIGQLPKDVDAYAMTGKGERVNDFSQPTLGVQGPTENGEYNTVQMTLADLRTAEIISNTRSAEKLISWARLEPEPPESFLHRSCDELSRVNVAISDAKTRSKITRDITGFDRLDEIQVNLVIDRFIVLCANESVPPGCSIRFEHEEDPVQHNDVVKILVRTPHGSFIFKTLAPERYWLKDIRQNYTDALAAIGGYDAKYRRVRKL